MHCMINKTKITRLLYALTFFSVVIANAACRRNGSGEQQAVPMAPDYADTTQWYIVDRSAAVDLFYVISTETGDYVTSSGVTAHYADTYDESLRGNMFGEMDGVERLLSGGLNYFSPYYRQCTLESFVNDSLMNQRMPLALGDVRRAFDYYLKHLNHGRPFILAGFSQGAMAVVDLLKHMEDSVCDRMVAAYVIGWKVTEADIASTTHIKPAKCGDDLGVTVCFNSVENVSSSIPIISDDNCVAINPVNWHVDGQVARFASPISDDTVSVWLDTESSLLVVEGYSRKDYVLPLIGKEGNYHSLEISLYRDFLRHNINLRASTFVDSMRLSTIDLAPYDTTGRCRLVNVLTVSPLPVVDVHYYDTFNFVGRRVDGYLAPVALLTRRAADSIDAVCRDLAKQGLTLKIFDAYRPQMAVDHFVRWSHDASDTMMQRYFYPNVGKRQLFARNYISSHSAHTRGSTVDVTLVDLATRQEVDMGGRFDMLDPSSHPDCGGNPVTGMYRSNDTITEAQFRNRMLLRRTMMRHGFRPLHTEWWHFTLRNEPYPDKGFTFPVY